MSLAAAPRSDLAPGAPASRWPGPPGPRWMHEIKFDGYRMAARNRPRQGSTPHPVRTRLDGKVSGNGRRFAKLPVKMAYIN